MVGGKCRHDGHQGRDHLQGLRQRPARGRSSTVRRHHKLAMLIAEGALQRIRSSSRRRGAGAVRIDVLHIRRVEPAVRERALIARSMPPASGLSRSPASAVMPKPTISPRMFAERFLACSRLSITMRRGRADHQALAVARERPVGVGREHAQRPPSPSLVPEGDAGFRAAGHTPTKPERTIWNASPMACARRRAGAGDHEGRAAQAAGHGDPARRRIHHQPRDGQRMQAAWPCRHRGAGSSRPGSIARRSPQPMMVAVCSESPPSNLSPECAIASRAAITANWATRSIRARRAVVEMLERVSSP